MKERVKGLFFALLRSEICGTEFCRTETPSLEELQSLYKLSKKHDLTHIIANALEKNGYLPDGSEAKKYFDKERNTAIFRYEQLAFEYARICQALDETSAPYLPLKGSVIRSLYPEAWMRTSCDIDILVPENRLDETKDALIEKLGYTCPENKKVNEISLYSENGVHLELHYDLTEGDRYGKKILSHIFDYTVKTGNGNMLALTDEAFYFYHIAHMMKHFEFGGCGVRYFIDLWILNNKLPKNSQKRDELLKKGDCLAFAKGMEKLCKVWFDGVQKDEQSQALEEYILSGGTYGTMQNLVTTQQAKKGGKFRYILSRIFISNKELKLKYPALEKRPYLAPFYHIRRWFKPLFKRDSAKRSFSELNQTAEVTEEEKQKREKLLKNLEIK